MRRPNHRTRRQGRRLRVLQGLPSRGDPAPLEPRARARLDAGVARIGTASCRLHMTGPGHTLGGVGERRQTVANLRALAARRTGEKLALRDT
jgi:hypothetical protein